MYCGMHSGGINKDMETGGLVTVIIPVYNTAPYLTEALDSVLRQDYSNLEIIIIDDGSTDGSEKICERYAEKDKRICVIHQNNKGLSGARNAGLDIMSGEAVAFLDSDDALHPAYVSTMMTAMIREKADLVICRYSVHHSSGKMVRKGRERTYPLIEEGLFSRDESLRALADGKLDHHVWNNLYKRELWNVIRFPDGHVYEDVDTTFRVVDSCKKICVLNESLYLYRKRAGSIIDTRSKGNIKDCILACSHFESFVKAHTPGLFSEDQLRRTQQPLLEAMTVYYARFSSETDNSEEKEYCNNLKQQITCTIKENGFYSCFHLMACYWMIRLCPWLLRSIYPVYHSISQGIKKRL